MLRNRGKPIALYANMRNAEAAAASGTKVAEDHEVMAQESATYNQAG